MGRLATQIAGLLLGKHKPTRFPSADCGDHVVVVNAEKVEFTGTKRRDKLYIWHTGYVGGLKRRTAREMFEKAPERVLMKAVAGMLPRNETHKHRMKRLRVFVGPAHPYKDQVVGFVRPPPPPPRRPRRLALRRPSPHRARAAPRDGRPGSRRSAPPTAWTRRPS